MTRVKTPFQMLQRFCHNHSDVVVWKRTYKLYQLGILPAIKTLFSVLATLAVFSACAERAFFTLQLLKS